jgi:hypothetical protein
MALNEPRHVVERLWSMFDAGDFDVGALLHDDFICEWIKLLRTLAEGASVVSEVVATDAADPAHIDRAVSFFDFRDGLIVHLREFWPDPFEAEEWRARWAERT